MKDGFYWCKVVEFSEWTIHKIKNGFVVSDSTVQKYEIDQFYEIGDKVDVPVKYRASIEQQVQPDSASDIVIPIPITGGDRMTEDERTRESCKHLFNAMEPKILGVGYTARCIYCGKVSFIDLSKRAKNTEQLLQPDRIQS